MRPFLKSAAVFCLLMSVPSWAAAVERLLDFGSGFVVNEPPVEGVEWFPSLVLQSRLFAAGPAYVSALVSADLGIDDRNPERLRSVSMLGIGAGGGVFADLGESVTLFAGCQAQWLNAWDWPIETTRTLDFHDGLRAGPDLSLAFMVAKPWGHPLYVEPRAGFRWYWINAIEKKWNGGFQAGLHFTGVLFPEPEG